MSRDNVIAVDGKIPWKHTADLLHFHATTVGKPIIMGRKTFSSIGKPLSGRKNIVISRQSDNATPGVIFVSSREAALEAAGNVPEIMIIGGAEIYAMFAPVVTRMYISTMDLQLGDGDSGDTANTNHIITYFPYMPSVGAWTCVEERTLESQVGECSCKLQIFVTSR